MQMTRCASCAHQFGAFRNRCPKCDAPSTPASATQMVLTSFAPPHRQPTQRGPTIDTRRFSQPAKDFLYLESRCTRNADGCLLFEGRGVRARLYGGEEAIVSPPRLALAAHGINLDSDDVAVHTCKHIHEDGCVCCEPSHLEVGTLEDSTYFSQRRRA